VPLQPLFAAIWSARVLASHILEQKNIAIPSNVAVLPAEVARANNLVWSLLTTVLATVPAWPVVAREEPKSRYGCHVRLACQSELSSQGT